MTESKARSLASIIDNTGDVKSTSLDNVSTGLTVYATLDDLPTSGLTSGQQAFVTSTNRVYVSNGSGWYSVALFNATPRLTIDPTGAVTLATDGSTPTVITLTGTDSDNADANLVYSVESDGSFANIAILSQDSSVFTITPLAEGSATPGSSTLTFKVSDGVSFGSGTTTFSLTFSVDWSSNTETVLRASDAGPGDRFGGTAVISGNNSYIAVGADGYDDVASNAGAIYVFNKSGSNWTQQQIVTPAELSSSDAYAARGNRSIAINPAGTYLIGGSINEDGGPGDPIDKAGAAYIFTRSGSTWTEQAILRASDAGVDNYFGKEVGISDEGDYAIVSADYNNSQIGAAYVFTRSGSTWTQQAKLTPSDGFTGNPGSKLGMSLSMNSDATYACFGSNNAAAYVFTRSGSTWTQQQKITTTDANKSTYFGQFQYISADANYLFVCDPYLQTNVGAVFVFTRSGSTWTQQAKIQPTDIAANWYFGGKVCTNSDGSYIVANAYANGSRRAYIFERSGSTWTQVANLQQSDGNGTNDFYGVYHVEISRDGSHVLIGSAEEDGGVGDPISGAGMLTVYEAG
jgi:hypothetical protein